MLLKEASQHLFLFLPDPAAVSNISVIGGTTNLSVSWTRASGIVSSYSVSLYRGLTQVDKAGNLSKDTLTTLHLNLTPGVVYCVVVVTHADSLTTSSSVCNATCESQMQLRS